MTLCCGFGVLVLDAPLRYWDSVALKYEPED
jgi:hypothetical protein